MNNQLNELFELNELKELNELYELRELSELYELYELRELSELNELKELRYLKICLACSHGGHLVEMQRLMPAFEGKDCFFVTYKAESSPKLERAYYIEYRRGYFRERLTWLKTIFVALRIMAKERPDVVISTGGGEIAIPFCYAGKLLGARVILIETLTRTTTKSAAGRFIYPIADLFLVQWESLLKLYGQKAQYWGKVI